MAEISVILPCFNVASHLDRCLTSLTCQTMELSRIELICVDDASTDDTWQKLQQWEKEYPENIIILRLDRNGRQGRARNVGLQYASGNWIAFVDSDDWVEPDYLEKLYAAACGTGAELIACNHVRDFSTAYKQRHPKGYNYSEDTVEGRLLELDTLAKRKQYIRMMSVDLTAWGKLIRKEVLLENEIFFPEELAYEDNYWGTLLHFYVTRIFEMDLPLYHYFVNEESTILKKNEDYHTDFLTVQLMKLEEFERRGFFETFEEEIAFDFLHACYLDFFKIICLRYDPPSFPLFQLLRQVILEKLPDYEKNRYFQEGFTEFQHMLIGLLRLPVTKQQFYQIAEHVKQQGI